MPDGASIAFVAPGRLETRTGGYNYDRRMIAGLRARGWSVDVLELDDGFPRPSAAALAGAARALEALAPGTTVIIDGLALGAMPAEVEREASRLRLVALVHLPLAEDVGLDRDTAARFEAGERRALAAVERVVVTGRGTAATLAGYGVGRDRITIVEPGTDRAPLASGSRDAAVHLLCVATLNKGKGHAILFRALASTPHRDWRLTCAGSLDRDPETVDLLRAQLRRDGLDDHVSLVGDLGSDELAACYDSADVFVLATLHESFGMAVAEALACGLPVVSTATGAIPELVGGGEAGLIVPPGDEHALADALSHVLGNADLRARLADGARRVRDRLPSWEQAVDRLAAALPRSGGSGRPSRSRWSGGPGRSGG
jgi:glycosyltransferase involved in cell wall biosynthesis